MNSTLYSAFLKKIHSKNIKGNFFVIKIFKFQQNSVINSNDSKKNNNEEKKPLNSINKDLENSNLNNTTIKESEKTPLLVKLSSSRDDLKDKERIDRNMNSLINIGIY